LGRKLSQFFGRPEKLPQGKVFSGKVFSGKVFSGKVFSGKVFSGKYLPVVNIHNNKVL
jgi:hypothetical protein